jgi:uncharacterized protein (TIGR03435 family)
MLVSRLMIAIGLACLVTPLALAQGALGSAAPPIEIEYLLQSPEGSKATLESLRGKVIVIDFWATWCMPCIRTMPHLNDLVKEFKGEPVQFIAVTKEPPSKIESFLTKHEIAAWVGIDANGSMFRDYRITGIPNTYIIDREGKIAARLHPQTLTSEMIRNVIDGKPAGSRTQQVQSPQRKSSNSRPLVAVDLRPSPEGRAASKAERPGICVMLAAPLRQIYARAYELSPDRVMGDKATLDALYDVSVRVPAESEALPDLLRAALAAGIDQSARLQASEQAVYLLEAISSELGPQIKPTSVTGDQPTSGKVGDRTQFANISMSGIANWLSQHTDRPIVDATNLPGRYDAEIQITSADMNEIERELKQLGLRLRPENRTLEVLLIEPRMGK